MNEPIISPWFFYILSVVDNFQSVLFVLTGAVCITLFFVPAWIDYDKDYKYLKRVLVILIVSVTFLVFVPSSNTITKMLIAQHATPTNIQMIGDGAEKAVDRVIEKIIDYQKKIEEKK